MVTRSKWEAFRSDHLLGLELSLAPAPLASPGPNLRLSACSLGVALDRSVFATFLAKLLDYLAPRAGLEPATQRLTDNSRATVCDTLQFEATVKLLKAVD